MPGGESLGPVSVAYRLLDDLAELDELLEVIRLLPAADSARLTMTCKTLHIRVSDPAVATWCADSRRKLLVRRRRRGDLPLGNASGQWTLERLHLCERPPRFPKVYFGFASDDLDSPSVSRHIARVAALLRRHPRLRSKKESRTKPPRPADSRPRPPAPFPTSVHADRVIASPGCSSVRIHGFAQPDAPHSIGEALAQARATAVRRRLLLALDGEVEWADEDPSEGVRADMRQSPWHSGHARTRVVGQKIEAVGCWRLRPRNQNFHDVGSDAESNDSDSEDHESDSESMSDVSESHDGDETGGNAGGEHGESESGSENEDANADDDTSDDDAESVEAKLRRAEFTLLRLE